LKSVKQSGNSKFHPEVKHDSIDIINKESNPQIKKERKIILEPEEDNVYCYDVEVNQDTSITNKYIEKLPIKQDGENIIVDQMPEFQGGNAMLFKYIEQNLVYPEQLQKEKIEGSVICSFIVGEDSTLSDIKIVRSLHPLLDEEAIRIVKSFPKWNPGKQNGIVVPVRFTMPIRCALPHKQK
ncbi:MAG: energy transducer TonB, partial [Bacteroidota bacterium]|nr:energy transducer TonB [Bacteroidota bacterium]